MDALACFNKSRTDAFFLGILYAESLNNEAKKWGEDFGERKLTTLFTKSY